jgi:two-component system, OmpR family, phosphate regulon sensor histidine kinase PhoR
LRSCETLALIQLFAETLELGRLKSTERAMEYYRIINSEARKLTRLIDNILDFSKMEAGLRPYKVGPQNLGELVERVLAALQSQFSQNRFTVSFEQRGPMPTVLVDVDAVQQALENLLTNAMKYSGESRDIVVRTSVDRGYACVSVADRGIGIPRRQQRKIFRKFYRVEADAVTGPQGCGLGLAIVDHTMRGHGGHVRVESEPGQGSTFTLCFPIPTGATIDEAHSGDRGRAADAARTA